MNTVTHVVAGECRKETVKKETGKNEMERRKQEKKKRKERIRFYFSENTTIIHMKNMYTYLLYHNITQID